jgi:hypothetical protein
MKPMTIKISEWGRGICSARRLVLEDGGTLRCCLGFLGNSCGFDDRELLDIMLPSYFLSGPLKQRAKDNFPERLFDQSNAYWKNYLPEPWTWDIGHSDTWETVFGLINDCKSIDEETRQAWLEEGFRQILDHQIVWTQ